jgi:epoxyqueuosine reductase QueG
MPARERGDNRVFVDDALSRAGIDLWGAAANAAAFSLAPALPTAISLLARIDPQALGRLEHGDAGAYRAEYKRLNARLDAAADGLVTALREKGHKASAAAATIYSDLPESGDWLAAGVFAHKTAATQAGLGWIGKTGLFVSPEAGPKVRLATVFTDLELDVGVPVAEGRCGSCRGCLNACPAGAGRDVAWQAGMARDLLFDAAACEKYMDSLETDGTHTCGLCVAACPFGRTRSS